MKVVMANGSNGTDSKLRKFLQDNIMGVNYENFNPMREKCKTFDAELKTPYRGLISIVTQHEKGFVTCYVRYDGKPVGYLTLNNPKHLTAEENERRFGMTAEEIREEIAQRSGYKYWIEHQNVSQAYKEKTEPARLLSRGCIGHLNSLEGELQRELGKTLGSSIKF